MNRPIMPNSPKTEKAFSAWDAFFSTPSYMTAETARLLQHDDNVNAAELASRKARAQLERDRAALEQERQMRRVAGEARREREWWWAEPTVRERAVREVADW